VVVSAMIVATTACGGSGGSSPTTPTGTSGVPTLGTCTSSQTCPVGNSIGILIRTAGAGPYTFTFANQKISGTGASETHFIGLGAGDYEVSGQQMASSQFGFSIGRQGSSVPGGVVPASLQSVEGLLAPPQSGTCTVNYLDGSASPTQPRAFRFKFTVQSVNSVNIC
jgi:hypothetical protein